MRDFASLYNNVGIIPKGSKEIANESAENCHCRQPQRRLIPLLQKTPANIYMKFILWETRFTGLHFFLLTVWVYLHSNFCGWLHKTHFETECIMAIYSHPISRLKHACGFLLVIHSNLGPILHHLWDMAMVTYCQKKCQFSYPFLFNALQVNPLEFLNLLLPKLKSLGYPTTKSS